MAKRGKSELDQDGQKTHYWIKPRKRVKREYLGSLSGLFGGKRKRGTSFLRLLNGREKDEAIKLRYDLYQRIWSDQEAKAQAILNKTNTSMFNNLLKFIDSNYSKLPIGLLLLTSNSANNMRILQELRIYLDMNSQNLYIASLNSKNCANIKSTLREAVKQLLNSFNDRSITLTDMEAVEDVKEDDVEDEADEEEGRVSYDFDIVEESFKNIASANSKLIVILEDTDTIDTQVLNQVFKILNSYSKSLPLRLIVGLSSSDVGSWVNSNLSNDVRGLLETYKFKSNDNKNLAYKIMDELFLNIDTPLALDSTLSSILLSRYENSNNSIDILLSEIKLCYMIHFYSSPLSALTEPDFKLEAPYINALKLLPTFKTYIEFKIHQLEELKRSIKKKNLKNEPQDVTNLKSEIKNLLLSDDGVKDLYEKSFNEFQAYKLSVFNAVNVIYILQPTKSKWEIYKLIVLNQFFTSLYLNRLFKHLYSTDLPKVIAEWKNSEALIYETNGVRDTNLKNFLDDLETVKCDSLIEDVISSLQKFFDNAYLSKSINLLLFSEIYTMNGGLMNFEPEKSIEENNANLMINLLRPNLRTILESSLETSEPYLKNGLILQDSKVASEVNELPLPKLFSIYKDAPVSINIYDLYTAFEHSLQKDELLKDIKLNLKNSTVPNKGQLQEMEVDWKKFSYSIFIQSCFELVMMGIMKERTRADFFEKALWKGL